MNGLVVTGPQLLDAFRRVGVQRGDVLYVASSLAALGFMKDPVGETLAALCEAVGPEGTLVMPVFNFGFCAGEPFDVRHTESTCGQLTEAFRQLPEAVRSTAPPYHGVAAVGPRAAEIGGIDSPTSFGPQSVFQYLYDLGARHLLIGCGYDEGVPHVHWLEQRQQVPYRFWKEMSGEIIDGDRRERRTFRMYARRLDPEAAVDAEPLGRRFEASGAVRTVEAGLCRIRAFTLADFEAFCAPRLQADPLMLLTPRSRAPFERAGAAGRAERTLPS